MLEFDFNNSLDEIGMFFDYVEKGAEVIKIVATNEYFLLYNGERVARLSERFFSMLVFEEAIEYEGTILMDPPKEGVTYEQ